MASIYKRGENWHISWYDSKGRQRKSLGKISKQEAEAKRKKIEYELAYLPTNQKAPQINFVDYVNTYLIQFLLKYPSTYQTQQHTLLIDFEPIFKNHMLHEITINDINGFIGLKVGHIKTATINRKLSILRALFNQAKALFTIMVNHVHISV